MDAYKREKKNHQGHINFFFFFLCKFILPKKEVKVAIFRRLN